MRRRSLLLAESGHRCQKSAYQSKFYQHITSRVEQSAKLWRKAKPVRDGHSGVVVPSGSNAGLMFEVTSEPLVQRVDTRAASV